MAASTGRRDDASAGQIGRAIAVLEAVAARGSSTARTIAETTGIPLPSVYRIARELIRAEYLVHLKDEQRFALGYRLHRLAVGLHDDLGVPAGVRGEIRALHDDLTMAAYLAIHRGAEFVVVVVVDSPAAPRLAPLGFGFHESPHATAFGKVSLSSLDPGQRAAHLRDHALRAHTPHTITDPVRLNRQLDEIARRGVAWEQEEFRSGTACLAAPVTAGDGLLIGSVAVSAPVEAYAGRRRHVEDRLRVCAARAGRIYRLGGRPG